MLNPGQSAYVGDSNNVNFYTYAHDQFGNQWAGNDMQQVYEGGRPRWVGFRWQLYSRTQADYTINFE
jgi:hypothetical protein